MERRHLACSHIRIPRAQISSGPGWVTLKFHSLLISWVPSHAVQIMPPAATRLPRRSSFLIRITGSHITRGGEGPQITVVLCHMARLCTFCFVNDRDKP